MTLEISYENNIIYKTEFYQSVIIPNIIFKGIKTPIINNDIGFGYDKKIKKDKKLEPLIPKDYGNDNIPYSIVCFDKYKIALPNVRLLPKFNASSFHSRTAFSWP